jgi:hypothetical protein
MKAKPNPAHLLFEKHLKELGLTFFPEFRFHKERKWRLDYILTDESGACLLRGATAIEIEGAIWSRGRHTRGKGYQADLDKYNAATMMGYRVLRFSTHDVLTGRAKAFLAEHLP